MTANETTETQLGNARNRMAQLEETIEDLLDENLILKSEIKDLKEEAKGATEERDHLCGIIDDLENMRRDDDDLVHRVQEWWIHLVTNKPF